MVVVVGWSSRNLQNVRTIKWWFWHVSLNSYNFYYFTRCITYDLSNNSNFLIVTEKKLLKKCQFFCFFVSFCIFFYRSYFYHFAVFQKGGPYLMVSKSAQAPLPVTKNSAQESKFKPWRLNVDPKYKFKRPTWVVLSQKKK